MSWEQCSREPSINLTLNISMWYLFEHRFRLRIVIISVSLIMEFVCFIHECDLHRLIQNRQTKSLVACGPLYAIEICVMFFFYRMWLSKWCFSLDVIDMVILLWCTLNNREIFKIAANHGSNHLPSSMWLAIIVKSFVCKAFASLYIIFFYSLKSTNEINLVGWTKKKNIWKI